MQATRRLVDLSGELSARVQFAENDLQSGAVWELRVRFNRNAATIVPNRDRVIVVKFDLDTACMACDGFVHRVVKDLGNQVVKRALVGAANIHPRALSHRFEALKDLDRSCVIGIRYGRCEKIVGHVLLLFSER